MFHVSFWCLTHYIAFLSRFISDVFFCLSSILLAVSIELQFKLYYYQYEWQNWNKCVQSWTGFILFESFLLFLLNQGAATDCSRFTITIIKATSENGANFRLWQIAKKKDANWLNSFEAFKWCWEIPKCAMLSWHSFVSFVIPPNPIEFSGEEFSIQHIIPSLTIKYLHVRLTTEDVAQARSFRKTEKWKKIKQ